MKAFLLEIDTPTKTISRIQYGAGIAEVAIMAENANLNVLSIKQLNRDSVGRMLETIKTGLSDIQ